MCELSRIIDKYFDGDENRKKEVAERIGMTYSTFARKTNPNDEDRQLNIRELIPYILNTDFSLLDHIEARVGRIAFEVPRENEGVTHKSLTRLIDASNNALSKMSECLEDGVVDEYETKELNPALIALAQRVNIIMAKLNK